MQSNQASLIERDGDSGLSGVEHSDAPIAPSLSSCDCKSKIHKPKRIFYHMSLPKCAMSCKYINYINPTELEADGSECDVKLCVIQAICRSNFDMRRVGQRWYSEEAQWQPQTPLYGRGVYFTDSITKADEYAEPGDDGQLYTMLICKVAGALHAVREIDRYASNLQTIPMSHDRNSRNTKAGNWGA